MARSSIVLILLILLALAACSRTPVQPATENAGKRIASVDVVTAVPEPVEIKAGGSGQVILRLTIQKGYHVNANPPTYSYLIPTALEIEPVEGVWIGTISYPPPVNAKFPFAEKPLAVYEGETEIKVTLTADKSAKPGERSLSATLRVQACDDQVCYPPGERDLVIPVSIK